MKLAIFTLVATLAMTSTAARGLQGDKGMGAGEAVAAVAVKPVKMHEAKPVKVGDRPGKGMGGAEGTRGGRGRAGRRAPLPPLQAAPVAVAAAEAAPTYVKTKAVKAPKPEKVYAAPVVVAAAEAAPKAPKPVKVHEAKPAKPMPVVVAAAEAAPAKVYAPKATKPML